MADAKDYLELWRERYSFPSYISNNFRLSEDGTIVPDNEEKWSAAQKILLQGSAVGTSKNFYLDPKPLFNKLGEIYTNIINSSFTSARTDAIKMNRNNMDYTNGSGLPVDQTLVYPFFCFLYNTPEDVTSKEVYNDWYNENVVIDIVTAISNNNNIDTSIVPNKITIDSKLLEDKHFPSFTKVEAVTLGNYLNYYKEWYNMPGYKETFNSLFNTSSDGPETFWNKHWYEINAVNSEILAQQTFYLPNEKFVEQFRLFKKEMLNETSGLQLLMPQYHRRVEVEDLDENFWVISIILDAVVNALWGPYGLIDVVRQLILKVTQIEDFLGLNNLTGIELLHNGSNDMYFDMYSRFTLSGLELKLKTQNGERVIKNIFKGQSDTTDRESTTDAYNTREELFAGIQFNEITPVEDNLGSTGLYDSDLISSDNNIQLSNGKNGYLSLSTVIDAINNRIVDNGSNRLSVTYDYSNGDYQDFFANLDITPDGTLTPNDLKQLSLDVTGDFSNLTQYELSRLNKYKDAKDFLIKKFKEQAQENTKSADWIKIFTQFGIKSVEDIDKLFVTQKGLMTLSANELDENGDNVLSDDEWLQYANEQLREIGAYIGELYKNTSSSVSTLDLLYEEEVTSILNLCEVYKKLEAYFYRTQGIENSAKYTEYIVEIFDIFQMPARYYRSFDDIGYRVDGDHKYYTIKVTTKNKLLQKSIEEYNSAYEISITQTEKNDENIFDKIDKIKNKQEFIRSILNDKKCTVSLMIREDLDHDYVQYEGDIMLLIDTYIQYNNSTSNSIIKNNAYSSVKINTKPYNAMGISPLEDIYTYNEFTAQMIAQYLAQKDNPDYDNFVNQIVNNSAFYDYYFDTTGMENENENDNPGISARDCATIQTHLRSINNAYYFYNMKLLRDSIKEGNALTVIDKSLDVIDMFSKLLNTYKRGNKKYTTPEDTYTSEQIKDILFTRKFEGSETITKLIDICVPSQLFLELISSIATPVRIVEGTEITGKDASYILQSIETHDYKLYGNILIFLYDENYYELKAKIDDKEYYKEKGNESNVVVYTPEVDGSDKVGLYVKAKDCFYTTEQPLIKYNLFYNINNESSEKNKDNTYALFVPRTDLINGEIIQLRLTEKNHNKKMLDFNKLSSNGFETFINSSGESSRLFLSLHNCFSSIPAQYNFRTTLFFDSTTPEAFSQNTEDEIPFKNVTDWFCNGIECQYFRPNIQKQNEDTILGTHQIFTTNLKINASMLSKKDPFNDNSFVFEEGPYDNPKTEEVYYTFSRRQAYCAAQRYNLLFYASPATVDGDMFVHSPLQLLQTPSTRSGDTIQPTRWSPIPEQSATDVMSKAGQTCTIADVKSMLYKNSLTSEKRPLVVDAIWGSRYVDDYVKNKKMQYIVIEREPGARHNQYGPNCIAFSQSNGYLHANKGTQITSLNEKPHWLEGCRINWYNKDGKKLSYNSTTGWFPPANAKYGVVDLTKFKDENSESGNYAIQFANNYMIRFYSSNLEYSNGIGSINDEFSFEKDGTQLPRRPIFRMAYFFGEDESGRSTIQTG